MRRAVQLDELGNQSRKDGPMTYKIICEESFQSEYGRPYQSERIVKTMLTLIEAQLECAEYNLKRKDNEYFFYRLVD
jgi:hypothetical protein